MLAFHFPPQKNSSGLQRTLAFSRYLLDHDWDPVVVTVHPRAYRAASDEQLGDIDPRIEVHRTWAIDSARHLAVAGRYSRLTALPDAWVSWFGSGLATAASLIRKQPVDAIWSTYPIATAHLIGASLSRLSGIPWIADFRDSMTEPDYPTDPTQRRSFLWVERRTVQRATRCVFTAPGALRMYRERYPAEPAEKFEVIENGFDDLQFMDIDDTGVEPQLDRPLRVVHSGTVYPSERDPTDLLSAIRSLTDRGDLTARRLAITLRTTGHDHVVNPMIEKAGVSKIIKTAPSVPYRQALEEMVASDALLLMQASNCNHQIPAKVYEYMRAGRPIVALTDPAGDTAQVVRRSSRHLVARLDSAQEIECALQRLLRLDFDSPSQSASVSAMSRQQRTTELAQLLADIT